MANESLNSIAEAYIAKLKEAFPDLEVEHYPDNVASYNLGHHKAAILVVYQNRTFKEGQNSDGSGQVNHPVFQITYVTRSLIAKKKSPGIYDLLDTGREALKELDFEQSKASIINEGFLDIKKGGVWMFGQQWKHTDYFE
ncbi:MAG: Gp37 family protein [Balneola sp.]